MKKTKIGVVVLGVLISCCLVSVATPVQANSYIVQELISMSPGDQQQRIYGVSDFRGAYGLGPIEGFLVLATSDPGTLSVTLKANPELKDPRTVVDFNLLGIGYSLNLGPIFFTAKASTPFLIQRDVQIDASFGFVWLGTYMSGVSGGGSKADVVKPVPFTITLSLSEFVEEVVEE
jgi:hypothetical protein